MAIYHLSVKPVARSAGRSATAASAYRAGVAIACEREGRLHDYTRKQGIAHTEIIVPPDAAWASDRSALWNAAELAEKRGNSTVAREYELALPAELSAGARIELVRAFGRELLDRYGVAADIAIHAPHREGDQRNWHAHVLTTTRRVEADGLGAKTRVLDDRKTGPTQVVELRTAWAELSNRFLEQEGRAERVDHRSLEAIREAHREQARAHQEAGRVKEAKDAFAVALGADRPAQVHLGPTATAIERKAAREAREEGRDYEPVTRVGAEAFQARALAQAARDYARAWVGYARAHYEHLSGRLEAAFSRIKERFLEQRFGRPPEGGRGVEPGQPGEARSFLARRESLAPQAPAPDAQRGSFLERRDLAAPQERSIDGARVAQERRNAVAGDSASAAHVRSKADAMEIAKTRMADLLSRISGHLPEGPARDELERRARSLLERAEEATKAQRRAEQAKGADHPSSAKEPSEAERQRQIDLENRERLLREERQRDRSEGQER